ncbi:hypothetical protein mru_0753 [Methanobrevibacter ruminantium M1]|uniref:DUF2779 domain-containing protein n=1 Tax=Methanobrevibacter ruminantium (strain ATCC 35063 / DSM 1093 / JCM 13430 / OCM 146 / M1) TaxID=634498 RepID=D3E243_METRM|nr:DUF2779 domain-containing protein [Methanobrevibacter ruminantium]ADC46604.1 hypothetical protein mru_0753 [Methanobrevibacter ruminantium M1]
MSKIHLSKSKYCKCVQCEKILWLGRYKPEVAAVEDKETIFENGRKVGELAKGLFGEYEDIEFDITLTQMIEKTKKLLEEKPNVITEASFSYENNFCSVDILKNDEDGVELYEVKSSTSIKEIYLDDVAFQYYVLSSLGLNVKKAALVYVNNEYIRGEDLDISQYFIIEDITEIAMAKQDEVRANIEHINNFMEAHDRDNEPNMEIGMHCCNPYSCDFWAYCTKELPKPNVFDISGMYKSQKFESYAEGKVSFEDLRSANINPRYLEQIDFELNDRGPKVEKQAIKDFLNSLKYPLYFIDYESCNYPIPELEGTKPYQQIPFQYSLHIIKEEGAPLEHKEFLGDINDKNIIRTFAEHMINDLQEDGSVIVYNKSFESARNREIGEMYPDLKGQMNRINDNMVDLMVPFRQRNYYTKEMEGSYSIKYVLPALYPDDPELDYGNLPSVHNGGEASDAFLNLKGKSPEEQEQTREDLLKYCWLDTYAMVKIWEKFKEVAK